MQSSRQKAENQEIKICKNWFIH